MSIASGEGINPANPGATMYEMSEVQSTVSEMQRNTFLRRIAEVSQEDPHRWVPVGIIGEELGLPYEATLAIVDRLREEGFVRRGGGGRLEPPHGPRVHILPEGVEHLRTLDT
jgi:RIO-like serine/threonine protein kinase